MKDAQLDVWFIDLTQDRPNFEVACRYLDAAEAARCRRFHFAKHQRRFAYTRLAVKTILAKYLSCAPQQVLFHYHAHGKPYLAEANHLQFNFSHTRDTAILVIGHTAPVGIDIECLTPRPFAGIARHVFTASEQTYLQALPGSLLPLGFFTLWTQKEAVVKAMGMGLQYPVQQLEMCKVSLHDLRWRSTIPIGMVYEPMFQKQWQLYSFLLGPAYVGAICCEPQIQTVDYHVYHPLTG